MLPSRGISRSLPPIGPGRRHVLNHWTGASRSLVPGRTGASRSFSSFLQQRIGNASPAVSPFSRRHAAAATVALGGLTPSTSRAFSLPGGGFFGGSEKPKGAPAEQPPAAAEAVRPVDPTPENVVPAPPTEPAVPASEVDLSSISELVSAEEILKMPEELGFLSAIGLDFGWGPSTVMQWVLEHVHVWTGLGWGGSIVVTSLLIRVALLYPQLRSLQFAAINQEMQKDPRSLEAKKLLQQAYAGTSEERMMRRQQYSVINKALRERYNVSSFDVLWGLLPIPFTFGLFRVLRNMTYIPVPSLETAGFLWFEDLVATDPYYILPVLSTAAMAGTVLVNMWVSPKTAQQEAMKPILAFVSLSGLVITCYLSAALNLMTVALGGATLASTLVFAIPSVRRRFGLPMRANPSPMSVKATYEPPRSAPAPTGIRERLSENLNGMKKSVSDSVSTYTGAITGGSEQDRAERNRKDLIRRLEAKRKEQEREAFEQKYKR